MHTFNIKYWDIMPILESKRFYKTCICNSQCLRCYLGRVRHIHIIFYLFSNANLHKSFNMTKYFFFLCVIRPNANNMNTAIRNEYTPAEALWAMYMSQSKAVRKAFRVRLHAEEEAEALRKNMEAYAKTLPPEELEAAKRMAESVKQGVSNVRKAAAEGRTIGRPAEELLAELMEEA